MNPVTKIKITKWMDAIPDQDPPEIRAGEESLTTKQAQATHEELLSPGPSIRSGNVRPAPTVPPADVSPPPPSDLNTPPDVSNLKENPLDKPLVGLGIIPPDTPAGIENQPVKAPTWNPYQILGLDDDEIRPCPLPAPTSIENGAPDATSDSDGLDHKMKQYLHRGPAGFHVTHVNLFLTSKYVPKASECKWKRRYKDGVYDQDPDKAIKAFNRSRDIDRICPACTTLFRVGEYVFERPRNYDAFHNRPNPPSYTLLPPAIRPYYTMQLKQGYCGPVCHRLMRKRRSPGKIDTICQEATDRERKPIIRGPRAMFHKRHRRIIAPPEGIAVTPTRRRRGARINFIESLGVSYRETCVLLNIPPPEPEPEPRGFAKWFRAMGL